MRQRRFLWLTGILVAATIVFVSACGSSSGGDKTATPTGEGGTPAPTSSGEVPGVTDTEVTLGTHTSLSGPISAYNVIPYTTLSYFDSINAAGGVDGRMIKYLQEDDMYSPALAVDLTRKLVEQDHIFAMFNALGTPNHLQVIDYLQENGVPDMFVATGATEWVKDPSARPLVFGSNPNYTGEGLVAGKYASEHFDGQNYGIIYQNDDFGQDGVTGVNLGVNGTMTNVGEEPYEVTDADLFSQIDTLRANDANVVVMFATPLLLANAIKHARADLNWDVQFIISAVSMNELTQLIGGPENLDGTVGPVATYMAWQTDIPGIAAHKAMLDQYPEGTVANGDAASVLTLYAQYVGELMVESLRNAGPDLTRESLVQGAEAIKDWTCSVCLFPLTLGPDDHDPGQGVAIGIFRNGRIEITDEAYSWEGIPVDELSVDKLTPLEVPADALP